MKVPRVFMLIVITGLLLIAVALQTEKPSVRMDELRPDRLATHFRVVRFAPGTDIAWAAGFGGMICRTADAGRTWEMQTVPVLSRFYGMHVQDARHVWVCGSDGTLVTTSNGGKSWRRVPVPTRLRLLDVCFINETTGWLAGDHGLILQTTDGGKTWRPQDTGVTSGFRRVWFGDARQGFAVGYEGVALWTGDGGEHWEALETPEHISFYGADFRPGGRRFHLVGSCGMMIESDDGGATCRILPLVTTNFLRDVAFDETGRGVAAGYGVLLRYDPGTGKWTRQQDVPGLYLQSVALGSRGQGIAVGRWGSLLRTEDAGIHWIFDTRTFAPDLNTICGDESGYRAAGGADGWVFVKSPATSSGIPSSQVLAGLSTAVPWIPGGGSGWWATGKACFEDHRITDGSPFRFREPVI
ncbi:MAG TPA: YCF48-related protein [bacterium]|nr:YCF48-related protein [bacterium]